MKIFRRLLSFFLAVVLLSSAIPLTGCAPGLSTTYKDIEKSAVMSSEDEILPDRPYIKVTDEEPDIGNIQDFLISEDISIDTLMNEPQLEQSLLNAEDLSDVVHSKTEMEGLKTLQSDLGFILEGSKDPEVSTDSGNVISRNRLEKLKTKIGTLIQAVSVKTGDAGILTGSSVSAGMGNFAGVTFTKGPVKGTWTTPNRIILRWTPQEEWIPVQGYNLYRTVNGQTKQIAEGLGSKTYITNLVARKAKFSDFIGDLYEDALLDEAELKQLGYSKMADFNRDLLKNVRLNTQKLRISGSQDFKLYRDNLLKIPSSLEMKIPMEDTYAANNLQLAREVKTAKVSLTALQTAKSPASLRTNFYAESPVGGVKEMSIREQAIAKLQEARNNMVTKAFLDAGFANESGLGYEDQLSGETIAVNTPVKYDIVPVEGAYKNLTAARIASGAEAEGAYAISVRYGVETPVAAPAGLEGYGVDNTVSLRWEPTTNAYEKSILSGYQIERRKKSESDFTRINESPVAISYMEDKDDPSILYENVAFFMDYDLKNGEEADYRIQALDIFGRLSPYSSVLPIKVYKVTPPKSPVIGEPKLTTKLKKGQMPGAYGDIITYNQKRTGVILPITKITTDSSIFVVYRSKAKGTGFFDTPQELVRIDAAPYMLSETPVVGMTLKKNKFIIRPKMPQDIQSTIDILYFDDEIEKGCYYKYWVSAVDSWGNESTWSESKIIGYALEDSPADPVHARASMDRDPGYLQNIVKVPGLHTRYLTVNPSALQSPGISAANGLQSSNGTLSSISSSDNTGTSAPSSGLSGITANPSNLSDVVSRLRVHQGVSVSQVVREGFKPQMNLSIEQDNLPKLTDIHAIIAVENEDIQASGNVRVQWYHYAGEGISGYMVYRTSVDEKSFKELKIMSKEQLLQDNYWTLVNGSVRENQLVDKVEKKNGRIYLYMISLIPQNTNPFMDGITSTYVPAGYVRVFWDRPADPQVSRYNVYRAEVPYFKENENMSKLEWIKVGDSLKYTTYTEKADQTYAHYYYYKITSVSTWGVESENGGVTKYRVPSTVPPQTPAMLVPFSKKATNQINWTGVPHASKYVIYRYLVDKPGEEELSTMSAGVSGLMGTLFNLDVVKGVYYKNPLKLKTDLKLSQSNAGAQAPAFRQVSNNVLTAKAGKFKTIQLKNSAVLRSEIQKAPLSSKLKLYNSIVKKYGPLAVAPISALDYDALASLTNTRVGELVIPQGEDSTGKKTFYDKTAKFGETYLYCVQAWNDDDLCSDLPEPVSVFTRKGQAFPPVTGVRWEKDGDKPRILWNAAKEPNLSLIESQEYIAGYLVYRSNAKDGDYYQASALIPSGETFYTDVNANLSTFNWYKVKVVDTAGYISDFSGAVLARTEPTFVLPNNQFKNIKAMKVSSGAKLKSSPDLKSNRSLSGERGRTVISLPSFAIGLTRTTSPSVQIIKPGSGIKSNTAPSTTTTQTQTPMTTTPSSTPGSGTQIRPETPSTVVPTKSGIQQSGIQQKEGSGTITQTKPSTGITEKQPSKIIPKATSPVTVSGIQNNPGKNLTRSGIFISGSMLLNNFTITDISLVGRKQGSGTGKLNFGESYQIPVNVTINTFEGNVIRDGYATLLEPIAIGETGVYIQRLEIRADRGSAVVSGYVKRDSGNLMGDIFALKFDNCTINPYGCIYVKDVPVFHYQNLTFTGVQGIVINPNQYAYTGLPYILNKPTGLAAMAPTPIPSSFITFAGGYAETSMGLETVDNKGFEYVYEMAGFDAQGRLSGVFKINGKQYMRTVIPAGLGIITKDSSLVYFNGSADTSKSFITGQLVTEYATFEDEHVINQSLVGQSVTVSLQNIKNLTTATNQSGGLTAHEIDVLDRGLQYMANLTQSNALLVAPATIDDTLGMSQAPFTVTQWDGNGFLVENTVMTPTVIGQNAALDYYSGNKADPPSASPGDIVDAVEKALGAGALPGSQGSNGPGSPAVIRATPGKVAIDLSRSKVYSGKSPDDTKIPEWMGIVIKDGNVSLPPNMINAADGNPIRFTLTPGELLYDQNGFCYQNQAYTPEGVPAKFGGDFGEFPVTVYNIVLDLYGNKPNLQIEGDMPVPLFKNSVKVKVYLDEKIGKYVCTVAETEKFSSDETGNIKTKILNGYLAPDGLHVDGTLDFAFKDKLEFNDIQFNELIIPSDMRKMSMEAVKTNQYGKVIFDKPYLIHFQKFPMEIRTMNMYSIPTSMEIKTPKYSGRLYNTTMTFQGGMQLSDNLAANAKEDLDKIVIGGAYLKPTILYEQSKSQVVMNFEEFAEFQGTGTPTVKGDLVEYNTNNVSGSTTNSKEMNMNFSGAFSALKDLPIKMKARFGYDTGKNRSYFAVAIQYDQNPGGIPFGFGTLNQMTGLVSYNMKVDKRSDGTFNLGSGLLNAVDSMKTDTSGGGNYFFGVSANMYLGYSDFTLGKVQNLYFVVEKGPTIEMAGTYLAPTTPAGLRGDQSGLTEIGKVYIGYYHSQRLFKFGLTLNSNIYGFAVTGDVGFDMCPSYWELRLGYPNPLQAGLGDFASVYFGLGIRYSDMGDSFIKAQAGFNFDTGDITIAIVYVRAYLAVGGSCDYYIDQGYFNLTVFLRGGVEGGIKVKGKRFNIISLMLDANGNLNNQNAWHLSANATIRYHLDLWLFDVGGSVNWGISRDF